MSNDGAVKKPGAATKRPRLAAIVHFRSIAIILIVAGHSFGLAGVRFGFVFDDTLVNLIKGATALFVFISGFLFDYVYGARFDYRSFILDRAKKLLIPYGVLTILAGLMFSNWAGGGLSADQLYRFLLLGDAFQAYWYIPFILLLFALTPLYRSFIDLRTSQQAAIIIGGTILGGIVHRPIGSDDALQSVIFYLPIYLAGLFLSLHRDTLLPVLQKYWTMMLLTGLSLAVVQALGGQSGNMHKALFALNGFELMGLQKLALSLGLIGFFATFSSPPSRIVRVIAETSFAIFFLHPFVLKLLSGQAFFRVTHVPWVDLAIATAAIVASCALVALTLRAILRDKSKYFIGY